MTLRQGTFALAIMATATALCLATLAAWERGGTKSERAVWIGLGIVLVASAHLLPSVLHGSAAPVRVMGYLLWGMCMVTACYGHVTFFLLAQIHAGDSRAATVPSAPDVSMSGRSLTAVMTERAALTQQIALALARAQRCSRDCALPDGRRATLAARLDALDVEASEIRRQQAQADSITTRRETLQTDPVTSRFATLLGTGVIRIDLLSGVLFSAVLEGVACLLWTVALRPSRAAAPVPAGTRSLTDTSAAAVTAHSPAVMQRSRGVTAGVTTGASAGRDDEVTRLAGDIAAGLVRPTVAGIRRYLKCSQARATALRREVLQHTP